MLHLLNMSFSFSKGFSSYLTVLFYFVITALFTTCTSVSAKEIILINKTQSESIRHQYTQEILIAALDSTIASHGEYEIQRLNLNQMATVILMRKEGYGDVIQGATREEWETNLIPIKIPILKGMLGLRVLFIHQDSQATFDKINSIEELKTLLSGAGSYWSITKVFAYHHFNLVQLDRQDSMYSMLEKKRFDYVTRGLHEALIEYEIFKLKEHNISIEKNLLINIPLPAYFFVNPNKPHLAKRIESGLTNIINNGVLDAIFKKHFKDKFQQLNLVNRTVFNLKNPTLSSPYHEYNADEFRRLFADKK